MEAAGVERNKLHNHVVRLLLINPHYTNYDSVRLQEQT